MKAYADVFGKKFTKDDVSLAASVVVKTNNPYAHNLRRYMQVGHGKSTRLIRLLRDAGVIDTQKVILRNEDAAINAALRQLKKGRE